jgi:hypothetical protein
VKANYKIKNGQLLFEVVGNQAKDIWEQVAQIQSLFEAETECRLCGCTELRYDHRVTKNGGYHFYELVCRNCSAFFRFGQLRQNNEIYPRRKINNVPIPNNGWLPASERFGGSQEEGEGDYNQEGPPDDFDQAPPPPPPPPRQAPAQQRPPAGQAPPQRQASPQQAPQQRPAQAPAQRQQPATAGTRHNASDLPYEAPPPRGGYR